MCLSAQLGPERQCIYRCITKRNTTISHSTAVHTWEHTQNPQIILLAYAILRRAKPPPGSPVVCTQASRWKACVSEYTDVSSLYNLIKAREVIIKITTGKKLYIRSLICKSTTLSYQVQHLIHSENSASHYARPIVVWACVSASTVHRHNMCLCSHPIQPDVGFSE